jgi:hypothetical protein
MFVLVKFVYKLYNLDFIGCQKKLTVAPPIFYAAHYHLILLLSHHTVASDASTHPPPSLPHQLPHL